MGRRPKEYSQAERLALMIRTLASRTWTVNDLAQEFAVSRRQVYRDLERIEKEGHPLIQSDGAGSTPGGETYFGADPGKNNRREIGGHSVSGVRLPNE